MYNIYIYLGKYIHEFHSYLYSLIFKLCPSHQYTTYHNLIQIKLIESYFECWTRKSSGILWNCFIWHHMPSHSRCQVSKIIRGKYWQNPMFANKSLDAVGHEFSPMMKPRNKTQRKYMNQENEFIAIGMRWDACLEPRR